MSPRYRRIYKTGCSKRNTNLIKYAIFRLLWFFALLMERRCAGFFNGVYHRASQVFKQLHSHSIFRYFGDDIVELLLIELPLICGVEFKCCTEYELA